MKLTGIIKGLHHVTATVNDAQEDYDFYTKTLGMRLVKETVNFDNNNVYHFYYGNEIGSPSTIFTTFPYKGQGVNQGIIGAGQVVQTSLAVPVGALTFWEARLSSKGISVTKSTRFGQPILEFEDPSGLKLDLIEAEDSRGHVWSTPEITKDQAVTGMYGGLLLVNDAPPTLDFLVKFGYTITKQEGDLTLLEAGIGGAGNTVLVQENPNAPVGKNGIGTVHHLAHRVEEVETSEKIKDYLENELGMRVTEVKDRKYFKSIYFRIPGGILFEIATEGPGFMVDESKEELGSSLKLSDWQEPNRKEIETNLIAYKR